MNTKDLPVISVVTPSFNQGRYLEDTITSVLDQNYPNLELIVCDGGSTDESIEVIRKYEKHLAWWCSEQDKGQTDAINKGLRRATGQILAYLNSDDFFLPNAFHYVAQAYQAHPEAGLYTGNGLIVDGRKANPRLYMREIGYTYDSMLRGSCYLLQPSTFINRKAWDKAGEFDDTLRFAMDLDYWLRIGRDFDVVLLNEPLSAWRMHEDIKTANGGMVRWHELWELYRKHTKDQITPGLLVELFSILKNPLISQQLGMDIQALANQCFNATYAEMQKTLKLRDCIPVGQGTIFKPTPPAGPAPVFRAYPPASAKTISSPPTGLLKAAEKTFAAPISAPTIVKATGSKPRVDIVLQATGEHAWAVGGGWETAARQLGVHHRTFRPRAPWGAPEAQTDDGLFAALANPEADVLFLAGFDWHSQVLHGSPRWQDRWRQCRAHKILYVQESILNHENLSSSKVMEAAFRRAVSLVNAVIYTDLSDRPLMENIGKPALFQPFGVDESIFTQNTPFAERLARAFFRGKHKPFAGQSASYQDRRALIQYLLDHQMLDLVPYSEKPVMPQELAADFNRFQIAVNFPSVFSNHPTRIYEAMACGCAVVTNRTGTAEIDRQFEHGQHLLYYSSQDELLAAVRELTANAELAGEIAKQGRQEAREKHTLHRRLAEALDWLGTPPVQNAAPAPTSVPIFTARQTARTIVIDGVIFDLQRHGSHGIGRVWLRLLEQLASTPLAQHIVLLDREGTAPVIEGIRRRRVPAFNFRHPEDDSLRVQQWCDEENARLFISTYHTCAENTPGMMVLHDMIPEITGQDLSHPEWRTKAKAITRSRVYLAVSQSTLNDFRRLYPQYADRPVTLAPNAVGDDIALPSSSAIQAFKNRHNLHKPYFLLVGNRTLYKNAMLFFRAFSLLPERKELEIVCLGGARELEPAFKPFVRDLRCQVIRVSDAELSAAYAGAVALVYPSQYEGFGLPILEAQKCDCPVITCRNSSLPEVAGDSVLYVGESDVNGLIQALILVRQPETRRRLLEAGRQNFPRFSWETTGTIVAETIAHAWQMAPTMPPWPDDPMEAYRQLIVVLERGSQHERQLGLLIKDIVGHHSGLVKYQGEQVTKIESKIAAYLNLMWHNLRPRLAAPQEWDGLLLHMVGLATEARGEWAAASELYIRALQLKSSEGIGIFHLRTGLHLVRTATQMGDSTLLKNVTTKIVEPLHRAGRGNIDWEAEQAALRNWSSAVISPVAAVETPVKCQPLISAIVSAYKSTRFLRGCLEDLENQTMADQLEIIVVDSHSPENERAIVEEFQKRYSNIVYIRSEERETVYGAWNRGIRAARGKYITNANTDDRHRADALEILSRALDQNPDVTLAYADCLITKIENETFATTQATRKYQWLEFSARDLLLKGCFCGPQPMWRREVHDEHGYFDAEFVSAGDYEFWLRLARTRKFLHVKEVLGLYLESPASVEHSNAKHGAWEIREAQRRYGPEIVPGFRIKNMPPRPASIHVKSAPEPRPKIIAVPPVALIGQLDEARELLGRKAFQAAWEATAAAISKRPFHPQAFLTLAEIALAAGDARSAKSCAQRARELAPGWDLAKQFSRKAESGKRKAQNHASASAIIRDTSCIAPRASCLSVCLIVKNEERFLPQCLQSIRGLGQQIVVVDTGSTDRTVEIAKEFGAEIYSRPWNDDFAAARNAALEHATGDWILMLDADEELPGGQHAKLFEDMKNPGVMAYRLPLVNRGLEAEGRNFVPRLFRNAPGAFYFGRVHEQVFPSLLSLAKTWGLKTALGTAEILHHGYSKEMLRDRNKIERNLKLLRQAVEENPRDVNLTMNFGLELVRSGDPAAGVAKYREAFQLMSELPPDEVAHELREVLLTQFTSQLYKVKAHEEVVRVLNSPAAKNGGLTASLHFALGLSQFELRNYSEAAAQMRLCLARRKQPAFSPINTDILTAMPNHCLALALAKTGDIVGAEKAFQLALAENGRGEDAKLDYAKFLTSQHRPIEALHQLKEIITVNSRNVAAWRLGGEIALSKPEFLEFARDWTGEAMRYVAEDLLVAAQCAEALVLSGDTAAAAGLWEWIWNADRQSRTLAALILCETIESQTTHAPDDGPAEQSASREFVVWYKKLAAMKANATLIKLNEQTDKLSRTLPTAAKLLERAMAEAGRSTAVAT
jgi:glycosyltransferase involved in cell wall biosynthesis